ncbi:hypothetical protein [Telmatospirillum sp.]|uniref:hypothetical protein n=1 Tax=Telmatospirillum sp. TaxID=2079197 RepID=UPI00284E0D8B|nr:hypothetical protein [Telmatospirillum sp.]MDR3438936.1 hypothetical protein [Telmatospirillum sp.]
METNTNATVVTSASTSDTSADVTAAAVSVGTMVLDPADIWARVQAGRVAFEAAAEQSRMAKDAERVAATLVADLEAEYVAAEAEIHALFDKAKSVAGRVELAVENLAADTGTTVAESPASIQPVTQAIQPAAA